MMERLFQQLIREKRRFIVPCICFLFIFYFSLPLLLAFFPEQMNQTLPFTQLPWGWLYAFAQFVLTWILGWMYWIRAKRFDRIVALMKQEGDQ